MSTEPSLDDLRAALARQADFIANAPILLKRLSPSEYLRMALASAGGAVEWLEQREDAARLEGFCDAESLVVAMHSAQAEQPVSEALRREVTRLLREDFDPTPPNWEGRDWDDNAEDVAEKLIALLRTRTLRECALAVSVGQHRTDHYDPDELAKAHRRAANTPQQASNGGKASAARMTPQQRQERARRAGLKGGAARAAKRTPEQRKEQATAAATARWGKGEPE